MARQFFDEFNFLSLVLFAVDSTIVVGSVAVCSSNSGDYSSVYNSHRRREVE